jgi:hypothetical protein
MEPGAGRGRSLGMMRISSWFGVSLMTAVATIAGVGFMDAARMNDAPTASECVDDWNARAGQADRARVAAEEYRSANVQGWFTDVSPGCGIRFIGLEGDLALSCTRPFDASDPQPTRWSCEWRTTVPDDIGGSERGESARIVSGWHLTFRA